MVDLKYMLLIGFVLLTTGTDADAKDHRADCLRYTMMDDKTLLDNYTTPEPGLTTLTTDWYRMNASDEGVLMGECPKGNVCGTTSQAWLADTLPDAVDQYTSSNRTICIRHGDNCCARNITMEMMNCLFYIIARHVPLQGDKRYCFYSHTINMRPTPAPTTSTSRSTTTRTTTTPTTRTTDATSIKPTDATTVASDPPKIVDVTTTTVTHNTMADPLANPQKREEGSVSGTICPDKWMPFQGSCYLFGHYNLHFTEAEYMFPGSLDFYWLGMTDEYVEGNWRWFVDGSSVTFTDWAPTEPQNAGVGEDCAMLDHNHNYQWSDVRCTTLRRAICELSGSAPNGNPIIG